MDASLDLHVECAWLCRIIIDDKFLLSINYGWLQRWIFAFAPIGWAYHFFEPDSIQKQFEISWIKGVGEMRFLMKSNSYDEFEKLFLWKGIARENSPKREFFEEFTEELSLVYNLVCSYFHAEPLHISDYLFNHKDFSNISFQYAYTVSDDKGWGTIKNIRKLIEVFDVDFPQNILNKLQFFLSLKYSPFRLVTMDEIENGVTLDGVKVANWALALVADKKHSLVKNIFRWPSQYETNYL